MKRKMGIQVCTCTYIPTAGVDYYKYSPEMLMRAEIGKGKENQNQG
jgi:hypothetical protein